MKKTLIFFLSSLTLLVFPGMEGWGQDISAGKRVYYGQSGYLAGTIKETFTNGKTEVLFDNGYKIFVETKSLSPKVEDFNGTTKGTRAYYPQSGYGVGTVHEVFASGIAMIRFDDSGRDYHLDLRGVGKGLEKDGTGHFTAQTRVYHSSYGAGRVKEIFSNGKSKVFFDTGYHYMVDTSSLGYSVPEMEGIPVGSRVHSPANGSAGSAKEIFSNGIILTAIDSTGRTSPIQAKDLGKGLALDGSGNFKTGTRVYHPSYSTGSVKEVFSNGKTKGLFDTGYHYFVDTASLAYKVDKIGDVTPQSRVNANNSNGSGYAKELFSNGLVKVTFDSGHSHFIQADKLGVLISAPVKPVVVQQEEKKKPVPPPQPKTKKDKKPKENFVTKITSLFKKEKKEKLKEKLQEEAQVCSPSHPKPSAPKLEELNTDVANVVVAAVEEKPCCVVCMEEDKPRSTVLIPCGHLVLCEGCAKAIHEKKQPCPICRSEVTSILKTFGGND